MKRKLTLIIVDDDPAAIEGLLKHCETMEGVVVLNTFTNPREALVFLKNNYADVVLLDVEMPDINGFEFLAQMPTIMGAILCTGHEQSASDVFEYNVYDYLSKPVDFKRFAKAIARAEVQAGISDKDTDTTGGVYYYFFARNREGRGQYRKINFEELVYIETTYNLTTFCLLGLEKRIESRIKIKKILDILPSDKFYQIHRNFIINVDYLQYVESGVAYLKYTDHRLPVGDKSRFTRFYEWFNKNLIDSN